MQVVVGGVTEVPVETCDLRPTRLCRNVTQMVPTLRPVSRCADFPRKICSFGFPDPRRSGKPLISKWCYDDREARRLPRVRVSQLSKSYLLPLREAEREGRQIEKLPGLRDHLNPA